MQHVARKIVIGTVAAALLLAAPGVADSTRLAASRELAQAFGASLKQELQEALEQGGAAAAVQVCKDRAPQIASELSRQSGAKVRRTSLRFRNPANAPEPWETAVLDAFDRDAAYADGEPLEYFQEDSFGSARYMAAIRTGPVCLVCHGAAVADTLDERLAIDYPHDRARGYALGDVRGAFSVTWPRQAATPER
ncbi:MAG: DUF3365 domain-containing protein [Woeseiaceae bacterium]|nr:DUF3365 domain-containing protein [Woeseiaceae bacterium]